MSQRRVQADVRGGGRGVAGRGPAAARQRGSAWEANSNLLHRSLLTDETETCEICSTLQLLHFAWVFEALK